MREGEICGTTNPTPHQVLLDARFELPFGMKHTHTLFWKTHTLFGNFTPKPHFESFKKLNPEFSLET